MKTVTKVALKILQKSDKKTTTGIRSWNCATNGKREHSTQDTQMVTASTKSWKENTDRMSAKRNWPIAGWGIWEDRDAWKWIL